MDAEALIAALVKTPVCAAVYDRDGQQIFVTETMSQSFAAAAEGPVALLKTLTFEGTLEDLLDSLSECRDISFYARCTLQARVWLIRIIVGTDGQFSALFAVDETAQYPRKRVHRFMLELLESALDGFGLADEHMKIRYANPAMCGFLGASKEVIDGVSVAQAHRQGMGGYSVADALSKSRELGPYYMETVLNSLDGRERRQVSQLVASHQDPLDGSIYYSTIVRDISAVKDIEHNLAAATRALESLLEERSEQLVDSNRRVTYSQSIWRSIVDNNADLVVFTTATGEILFANHGIFEGSGITLLGHNVLELMLEQDREMVAAQFEKIAQGETEHFSIEATLKDSKGRHRRCFIMVNGVRQLDGSHAATWIVSDVSAEWQARQESAINAQLAAAGRMAARIAHEINNPLAAIRSSIAVIKMDLDLDPATETAHFLHMMESELDRVSGIIRQMYDLYRPQRTPSKPTDLVAVTKDCLLLLAAEARNRTIRLQLNEGKNIKTIISESSLKQILFNLIVNAMDASPPGEDVLLKVGVEGQFALLCVCDRGPGIPADLANQMFEPFFTTKDASEGKGLGLGLSVSLSLVREMGGDIRVRAREGGGAEFHVLLPMAATDELT